MQPLLRLTVASAYFPYDSQETPQSARVAELIAYYHEKGLPLLLGCDANSYHIVCRSSDTNARGEALLQYLVPTDLMILNKGNDLTFVNAVRSRAVIEFTLCSREILKYLRKWRVAKEASLLDHTCIKFEWFSEMSTAKSLKYKSVADMEKSGRILGQAIRLAYESSCSQNVPKAKQGAPW